VFLLGFPWFCLDEFGRGAEFRTLARNHFGLSLDDDGSVELGLALASGLNFIVRPAT
jgi:hypothetical protein